jgi:hypothetical protein
VTREGTVKRQIERIFWKGVTVVRLHTQNVIGGRESSRSRWAVCLLKPGRVCYLNVPVNVAQAAVANAMQYFSESAGCSRAVKHSTFTSLTSRDGVVVEGPGGVEEV